jgi:Putative Ig domain
VRTSLSRLFRAVVAGSVLSGGVVSVSALSGSLPAGATTAVKLYVSTTGTGTECTKTSPCSSIDQAVTVAEALTGDNVIIKVAPGTYAGSGYLYASEYIDASSLQSLSLEGAGASSTIIKAGPANFRVMYVGAGTVSLSGFTVENGSELIDAGSGIYNAAAMLKVSDTIFSSGAGGGEAIYNGGSLTLNDSTVSGYSNGGGAIWNDGQLSADGVVFNGGAGTGGGGAILNDGTATINDSTVSGTSPRSAGAILNGGTLHLNDSTVTDSSATDGSGGAILNDGTAVINDSTLTGNFAAIGGAIDNEDSLTLYDSTLSGNTTYDIPNHPGAGGALYNSDILTVTGTSVADNSAPQIYNSGTLTTAASIIAEPTSAPTSVSDCQSAGNGTISDLGYNLSDDASCGLSASTDVNDKPELGALGPNGGPTPTALPALGSPATGVIPAGALAGSTQLCGRVDQRGVASIGKCTIGAVEGGFLIETASLPDATPGRAYPPTQLTVQNEGTSTSPYQSTLKWKGLTLPSWLTLSPTGVLSGATPKSGALGTYSITLRVTETVTTVSAGVITKTKTTVEATPVLIVAPHSPA